MVRFRVNCSNYEESFIFWIIDLETQRADPSHTFNQVDLVIQHGSRDPNEFSSFHFHMTQNVPGVNLVLNSTLSAVRIFSTQCVSKRIPSGAKYDELVFFTQSEALPPCKSATREASRNGTRPPGPAITVPTSVICS